MLLSCLKCKKNTENKNPKFVKIKTGRIRLLSKYAVCDSKKSKFIEEQEASRLLTVIRLGFLRVVFSRGKGVSVGLPLHISRRTYLISI